MSEFLRQFFLRLSCCSLFVFNSILLWSRLSMGDLGIRWSLIKIDFTFSPVSHFSFAFNDTYYDSGLFHLGRVARIRTRTMAQPPDNHPIVCVPFSLANGAACAYVTTNTWRNCQALWWPIRLFDRSHSVHSHIIAFEKAISFAANEFVCKRLLRAIAQPTNHSSRNGSCVEASADDRIHSQFIIFARPSRVNIKSSTSAFPFVN